MADKKEFVEQRKRARVKLNSRLICFKLYDYLGTLKVEDLPVIIGLRDISFGGIGGASSTKLHVGDQASVNLTHGGHKVTFDLSVCWCNYNNMFYDVGFEYKTLTRDQVLFLNDYIKSLVKNNNIKNSHRNKEI